MTKIVDISELKNSIQAVIALTKGGDEIVLEENGEPIIKVVSVSEPRGSTKKRVVGLGSGKGYFISDDFDDELPDEFWGFDKPI
jgi:antitoxin (DNA-binding transcriptional repressor) of toxin-antitoxin stability system